MAVNIVAEGRFWYKPVCIYHKYDENHTSLIR